MKTYLLKFVIVFTILTSLVLTDKCLAAGPPSPPGGTGGTSAPPCWPEPCVPIDNGIGLLIAAGVIYGVKKLYDSRKTNVANQA